jgi:hypothetical protein
MWRALLIGRELLRLPVFGWIDNGSLSNKQVGGYVACGYLFVLFRFYGPCMAVLLSSVLMF